MPEDRRHIAVMFTDIVGYTALMGTDEDRAFDMLKRNHAIHETLIKQFNGTLVKEVGDGTLASFSLASDAVRCAIEIQKECKEQNIPLKIGIHEGEMVFAGADVLGDGVNIASRLQESAEEGCITFSGSVYRDIKNKAGIRTEFIDERSYKNVDEPIRVYKVLDEQTEEKNKIPESRNPNRDLRITIQEKKLVRLIIAGLTIIIASITVWYFFSTRETLPVVEETVPDEIDRSIAVLPFVNLSDDPEQEYFSDGMMEEILMHLYKIGDLRVTSRTSVMRYKGTTKMIKEIAGELGVAHILEGSVRKSGDNVRITVQLIDAISDKHLWAESYDRDLTDVFTIQSNVAQQIAKALKAEITPEVKEQIEYIPTKSLEAYNLYLQASFQNSFQTVDGYNKAIQLLERAIEIDPNFSNAYVALAGAKLIGLGWTRLGGGMDPEKAVKIGKKYILKAIEIDENNYVAHVGLMSYYLYVEWDLMNAGKEYNKAKELRPSYYNTDFLIASGRFEEAYEEAKKAMEFDPLLSRNWSSMILSSYFANRNEKTLKTIEEFEKSGFQDASAFMECARVYLYLGKYEDVINTIDKLTSLYGELKASSRILGLLAMANYYTGEREKAKDFLQELKEQSKLNAGGSPSFYAAMVYARMGETDLAFEWLEKAYKAHEIEMYWVKVEPPFEPLHNDPRWQGMLSKVGFPKI